jgi:hypothetical protein
MPMCADFYLKGYINTELAYYHNSNIQPTEMQC